MPKDDENRLQRSLNSLERRNKLARRKDDRADDDVEAADATPYSMSGLPVADPAAGGVGPKPRTTEDPDDGVEGPDGTRPTTDGMPPKAPGRQKPPGVHTDHLAATVAALRQLAASRPGFDVVVLDPSTEPLSGNRITSIVGNAARVVPVAVEVDDDGSAKVVPHDDSASELAAMLRRREK
jgi:hypothetical protein